VFAHERAVHASADRTGEDHGAALELGEVHLTITSPGEQVVDR
jgi:hypothetical protein